MRSGHRLLAAPAIAAALICAGCGSTASDANVIRGWAQALRAGKLDKAASYFALPAIVANGTPPLRITTLAQMREFNQLLPCGARLVSTSRHGVYTYATFRLTDRVGGGCGAGTGELAATAFRIRHGKIIEWRRLPTPGGGGQPPTPAPNQGPSV